MRLAPAASKYFLISHIVKSLRDNIAEHDAHGTSSQFPHTSVRCFPLVRLKADTAWSTPHFVQRYLRLCSPLCVLCFAPAIFFPFRRHVLQRMFSLRFRNPQTSPELYSVKLWLSPQEAHMILKQVSHVVTPHRNWFLGLHLAQPVQNVVVFRYLEADASTMTSEATHGDRTQCSRISSRFRCGV